MRLENLEPRCLLAGLVGDTALLSLSDLGEGESSGGNHNQFSGAGSFRYLPPQYVQAPVNGFVSGPASAPPLQAALDYLRTNASRFGLTVNEVNDFVVKDQYTSSHTGTTHIYLKQVYNGLEIANADLSINVAKNGEIVNVGSTFVGNLPPAGGAGDQPLSPQLNALQVFNKFGETFGYEFTSAPKVVQSAVGRAQRTVLTGPGVAHGTATAELQYVATQNGLELVWRMNVPTSDRLHWYDAYLAADDGSLAYLSDWVSKAAYNAFPIPVEDPNDGTRRLVVDPHDPIASPFGWHDVNGLPGPDFFDTRGNNVWAQHDRDGLAFAGFAQNPVLRPNGGPNLQFDFPLDLTRPSQTYTDASVTNLFFLVNMAHDIMYRYGFDEAAGNFQSLNYTQAGRGSDPVLALAQVGGNLPVPINNAFMATPPDGFQPLMVMGFVNLDLTAPLNLPLPQFNPPRASDLSSGVVIHEFGHGVSNRLTGGPSNSNALNAIQSLAMGEGWSDFIAMWALQRPTDQKNDPIPIAAYLGGPLALGPQKGIRRFPYSFDMTVNPLTFKDFNGVGGAACNTPTSNCESHNAGEIWAQILWDLNWILIEKYGYSSDLFNGKAGNNLAMQLVIDGMKLQPVTPTFTNARDAILAADLIMNKGVNHKEIWTAFARRGMGLNADSDELNTGTGLPPGPNFPGTAFDSPNSIFVREAFNLPSNQARARGRVWSDANGNGILEGTETGIPGVRLFVDLNGNNRRDPLEPTTTSGLDGSYEFEFFARGTYTIGQEVPTGFEQTFPLQNGTHTFTVNNGQILGDLNFGNRRGTASAGGLVFLDEDGDGRRHPFEPGMANIFVYADLDNDGRLDLGEPQARTAADGSYKLTLTSPGTYSVRQSVPPGFVQTLPARGAGYPVTIVSGSLNVQFEFGNAPAEDWGDAPAPYPTLSENNGAVHGFLPGFFLGNSVDLEANGNPNVTATGDDIVPIDADDEDGVTFTSNMFPGSTTNVSVKVNLKERILETVQGRTREVVKTDNSAGRLHAWVDFNRDGDWNDAGEKIFSDLLLNEGTHNLTFRVPREAATGITYARFRYGYEHMMDPTGRAAAGEVEDYLVRILSDTPDALDDVFSVDQNTTANTLNVLANDVPSAAGELTIFSVGQPTAGGTVLISPDGKSLRYTPRRGFIGNESFNYTIRDPAGATDTARVSVTVLPSFAQPIAVDDSFDVNENSANNELNVLANDLAGRRPPIGIVSFTSPSNGTVELDSRGTTNPSDDVFRYTPNSGFAGTESFQYTIEDASGQQSSATVTIHVQPGAMNDDLVQFRLEVTDINNRPIAAIGVGETFKVRAFIDDLRPDDGVPDSPVEIDRRGVGAAYFDLLYPFNLVSMGNTINFSAEYRNAISGNLGTPGIIDEVGALQTGATPLGPNELLLFEISAVATGVGTARFIGDPADLTSENPGVPPVHDTLLFEPPNTVLVRQQKFIGTTLEIVGSGGRPQATDNLFNVPINVVDFPLGVLGNDVERDNPPLRITAVGTPTSTTFNTPNGGRVTISADRLQLLYTPRSGFNGTEQFTYTVANSVGLTASATVTVQVGATPKDVNIRIDTTNAQGQHIDTIQAGESFQVRMFVQDVRSNPPDRNRMGVFAAYADLLYDGRSVSTIGDLNNPFGFRIEFGSSYVNGTSASNALPNVIDEVGAFQESFNPLGSGEFLLASITFRADRAGVTQFVVDPANISPLHDVLLFEPSDAAVALSRIGFRTASINILGSAEGESPFTNPRDRYDVNNDGHQSPHDALVVVNHLNLHGTQTLGAGEGESGTTFYLDVNGDKVVSPIDVLNVINRLNVKANGEGESALTVGPGLPFNSDLVVGPQALSAASTSVTTLQMGPPQPRNVTFIEGSHWSADATAAASPTDEVFANIEPAATEDDDVEELLAEDLFSAWGELDVEE